MAASHVFSTQASLNVGDGAEMSGLVCRVTLVCSPTMMENSALNKQSMALVDWQMKSEGFYAAGQFASLCHRLSEL